MKWPWSKPEEPETPRNPDISPLVTDGAQIVFDSDTTPGITYATAIFNNNSPQVTASARRENGTWELSDWLDDEGGERENADLRQRVLDHLNTH